MLKRREGATQLARLRRAWGPVCALLMFVPCSSRAAPIPQAAQYPPPVVSLEVSDDFEYVTVYIYNGAKRDLCLPSAIYDAFTVSVTYADGRMEKKIPRVMGRPVYEETLKYVECPDAVVAGESIKREFSIKSAFHKIDRRPFVICFSVRSKIGVVHPMTTFESTACSHVRPVANGKPKITPRVTQTRVEPGLR